MIFSNILLELSIIFFFSICNDFLKIHANRERVNDKNIFPISIKKKQANIYIRQLYSPISFVCMSQF